MNPRRTTIGVLLAAAAATGVAACGSSSSTTASTSGSSTGSSTASGPATAKVNASINGAGSTLALPIYEQWASTLKSSGLTVNYNGVGSGAGVTSLQGKTVAFAGSDPALKAADLTGFKGAKVLQFPVAAGAITVSYNLPGVKSGLKLTGPVIAEIFSRQITSWDNAAIKALNPGVSLPSTPITVIHRSDSSGTTNGFTTYLSDVSPSWKAKFGASKTINWPAGTTGAAKNNGVAAAVKATSGAVGYVEQAYALVNNFTYASVKNSSGQYILPTIPATSAAFTGITVPADLGVSTVNSPNASAYPIVSQTFIDAFADPCKDGGLSSTDAKGLYEFLGYALGSGQSTFGTSSSSLPYAGLPSSLLAKDQAQLKTMTCDGKSLS